MLSSILAGGLFLLTSLGNLDPVADAPRAGTPVTGVTLVLDGPLVALNGSLGAHVQLGAPAPIGGTLVTLGSVDPLIANPTVASILVAEGQTSSTTFQVSGLSLGTTTLTADASGCPQATASITTTNLYISLGTGFAVAPGQTSGLPLSLSIPAPPGGVTIGLSINPPGVAGIQAMTFIPEGLQTPIANPQVTGIMTGSAEVTAQAMGFAPDTRVVTVASNVMSFSPSPLNIPAGLTQYVIINLQVAAPPGGQSITLTTDHPLIATVPSPVFVTPGSNSLAVLVTGVAPGMTVLRGSAAGFPNASVNVNVIDPVVNLASVTVGDDLQSSLGGLLTAPAPPGNLVITLTSPNVSELLLANTVNAPGSQSIQVTVPAGSATIPNFYVHALTDTGTQSIQVSAPGYTSTPNTITFAPSGFVISTPGSISTSVGAPSTNVNVRSARLVPGTLVQSTTQSVRGGLTVPVTLGTSDPLVGFIANSPLIFNGGVGSVAGEFTPAGPGMNTVSVTAPAGFDTPSNLQSIPATVSSQAITIPSASIGKDLQVPLQGTLSSPAPAGNLVVTLTSSNGAGVLLANSPAAAGAISITVTVPAGSTTLPTWYAQAVDHDGMVTVTATAPSYGSGVATMTLAESGVRIWSPASISASAGAAPIPVQVRTGYLDAMDEFVATQQVRGGVSASIDVISGNSGVGTISTSPLVFTGGVSTLSTTFVPVGSGMTPISLAWPPTTCFVNPASGLSINAAVFDQLITVPNGDIGKDLQISTSATLSAPAPAGNLQVTLTSSDPGLLLLSTSEFSLGTSSITVQVNAGSSSTPSFWVQALTDSGSATVTAQASGYANGVGTFTFHPSGFRIQTPTTNFTTSTFSAPTSITLRPARLNATTGAPVATQRLRGGITASVPFTSSDINVGTNSPNPITHMGGDLNSTTSFTPLTAGTTTLEIGPVAGFSDATSNRSLVATVTAPAISMGTATLDLGVNLQSSRAITLAAAPPNPVNVTLTVLDPSVLVISGSATTAGGNSLVFSGVAGTSVGTVHLQGLSLGSTTVRAQAPGYSDAVVTVSVRPSGFIWWNESSINTTFSSAPTSLDIRAVVLNPVTLAPGVSQQLRAGASVNLQLGSSQSLVGTLGPSPLPINGGTLTSVASFQPLAAGLTTLNILTPVGFWTPSSLNSLPASVRSPNIFLPTTTVGRGLQLNRTITLEAPVTTATTFYVTVDDPSVAVLSSSSSSTGQHRLSFTITGGTTVGTIYVQGLTLGSTNILVSARGYEAVKSDVVVDPAGFAFHSPTSISTSTISPPTTVTVRGFLLNPTTLNVVASQSVRGGSPVRFSIQSSNTTVANLSGVSVEIAAGTLSGTFPFTPIGGGTTTLTIATPMGFSPPSNQSTLNATVTSPTISVGNATVGRDLQAALSPTLQAAPPAPVDVTFTITDPAIAVVSDSSTTAGSGVFIRTGVASTAVGGIWIQGLSLGTTQLTVSAPGYQTATAVITVHPSGFVISTPTSITTTAGAGNTSVTVRPARLDPVTLNFSANQSLRAGLTPSVALALSNPTVGTLTINPLTYSGGAGPLSTQFDPAASGSSVLSITQPPGFSIPSNLQSISVTVNP